MAAKARKSRVNIGEEVGKGVFFSEEDGFVVIRVDPKGVYGESGSGKSLTVGTTGGAKRIGGVSFNVNAYRPV